MGISRGSPILGVPPIISGTGKATDVKFGRYIDKVYVNKSPLKTSGTVVICIVRQSCTFSGHPYYTLGESRGYLCDSTAFLYTVSLRYTLNFCTHFYRAMHFSAKRGIAIAWRPSVRPSVTLVDCDRIGWKSWKLIPRTLSLTHLLFVAQRPSTYSQGNMAKFWGEYKSHKEDPVELDSSPSL